ncbi:DUF3619 family protein [Undibacterium sp. SXout20W]|uniref:DUF3619 family protein n=1 Tax=Undibacterium sp. SXout20W TaxID=3413051 RepID=UPI003BF23E18
MNYSQESQDLDFAYKVRRALNESAESLPAPTLDRLAMARKAALARKKPDAGAKVHIFSGVLAGNNGFSFSGPSTWFGRLGMIIPLLALVAGLAGIYQHEKEQRISELADIDSAVLVDELPPAAYVDTGFTAYLNKAEE